MSIVLDTRIRAFDSSGDPLVGATLTIYNTGTTTPASIYRDATLSTPMSNPTSGADASDSGGWFPQIFAAEGGSYDITLKTSGGSTVKTYVKVPSLGSDNTTLLRDFTSSRFQVRNVGGVVYIESGNASGDDVGGSGRLGGWNATQMDALTVDAANTNFTGGISTNAAAWLTLTDATTVAWDATTRFNAKVTLGGNRTIGAPTGLVDGQTYSLQLIQDATGSRTVTWNAIWDFGALGNPLLQTGASKKDLVVAIYDSTAGKLFASFRKGA